MIRFFILHCRLKQTLYPRNWYWSKKVSDFRKAEKKKLDKCVAKTLSVIHQSLILSTPRMCNSGKREPWWNSQCQDAVQMLKNRRREDSLEKAVGIENPSSEEQLKRLRHQLRKEVKQAKRRFYQEVINNFNEETIFQAMKWPNSTRKYTTPPIQKPDGFLATSNKDKQLHLSRYYLRLWFTGQITLFYLLAIFLKTLGRLL